MRRSVAVVWHASFSVAAVGLYFFFVLPRWWELTGATSHTLGTVLRIVAGALIALAALPVVFTLLRTRKPEYGTPQLALTLLVTAIVAHVLAGVLITGTAISEIWLPLDDAGQWLFGIYGAAAAIALLGIGAFYLSFVAELPPPPPKPLKAKKPKQRRRLRRKGDEAAGDSETEAEEAEAAEAEAAEDTEAESAEDTEAEETEADETETEVDTDETETEVDTDETEVAEVDTDETEVAEDTEADEDTEAEEAEAEEAEADETEAEEAGTKKSASLEEPEAKGTAMEKAEDTAAEDTGSGESETDRELVRTGVQNKRRPFRRRRSKDSD